MFFSRYNDINCNPDTVIEINDLVNVIKIIKKTVDFTYRVEEISTDGINKVVKGVDTNV